MFDQQRTKVTALLQEVDHAILIEDTTGRVIFWNQAAETFYGVPCSEAEGRPLSELITVERCSASRIERAAALNELGRWQGSGVHVTPRGTRLKVDWVQLRTGSEDEQIISLIKPSPGAPTAPTSLLQLGEDLQCTVGLDGAFKQVNRAWPEILGWSEEELLGRPWIDLIHPEDLELTTRTAQQSIAQGKAYYTVENRYRHRDGSYRVLAWSALILADQRTVFAIARDLTNIYQTREQLNQSEINVQNLFNASPMGIHQYRLDPDGQLIFTAANPASESIIGVSADGLIGKSITEAFPELADTEVPECYRRAARDGEPWQTTNLTYQDQKISGAFNLSAFQTTPGNMAVMFLDITPLTKVREALRSSEELFATAFHSSPALMTISTIEDGRFIDVNRIFEHISGYTRDEALGATPVELGLLQDPTDQERIIRQLQEEGSIPQLETTFINKHGQLGRGAFSFKRFDLGKDNLYLTVMTDITERETTATQQRERLERIQRQQEAIFRLATHAAITDGDLPDALRSLTEIVAGALAVERVSFWLISEDRGAMRCLDLYSRSTGIHSAADPLSLDAFPRYLEALERGRVIDANDTLTDPRTAELAPYMRQHGITSMMDATVRVSGNIRGVVCHEHIGTPRIWRPDEIAFAGAVADQVTQAINTIEQRRIELALRESETKLRSILRSAPVGICLVTEGAISWSNDRMARTLGYAPEELAGKPIGELYPSEFAEDHRALIQQLDEREAGTQETRWIRRDGALVDLLLNATRLDPASDRAGITITALDITERKRTEEEKTQLEDQLRQSQKMEAIGRLAGGIAHDFNNLLTGIIGYCDLIFRSSPPAEPFFSELKEIQRAGERAAELTNQLLAFSRKQIIAPRVIEPNQVIDRSKKMISRLIGEDVELTFRPATDLQRIKADPGQLDQILLNLAANSRDAMPDGGRLTIETSNITLDEAFCALRAEIRPGEYILLAVTDSGCGMPESVQKYIFEPFFSTKPKDKGTGLGLAMVYGIVKQNHGYISVYSEEKIGTTIKIYFPSVTEQPQPEVRRATAPLPRGQEHILLVEDEEIVRNLAKTVLEGRGYVVLEANNGLEAMQVSQQYSEQIHLLLTDVVLPKMNGRELYQAIRAHRPEIKVLFVSGYTENVIAHHGILEEGMNFMQKPFTIADLTARVREIIDN